MMTSTNSADVNLKHVLVIHGRNEAIRKAMFAFLRSLELQPIEWNVAVRETGKGSPYVGDVLTAAFGMAKAVIVLFTPDDEVRLRKDLLKPTDPSFEGELSPQARPNVLFEAGMSIGKNEDRTILVEVGPHRSFSDVYGRHVVRLNNSPQSRQALITRLQSAGCDVNRDGSDWMETGDFECWAAPTADEPESFDLPLASKHYNGRQLAKIVSNLSFIVQYLDEKDRTRLDEQVRKLVRKNLPPNDLVLNIEDLGDTIMIRIRFKRIMLKNHIDEFERRVRNELDQPILRWLADFDLSELVLE